MAQIQSFNVNNLRNENHLPYVLMILLRVQNNPAIMAVLKPIVDAFAAAVQREDEAMHPLRGSEQTKDIQETDKGRDSVWVAFREMVDAYLRYPDAAIVADAQKLEPYMKANKVETGAQYDRETGQILNLVQDLETYCAEELERLNLMVLFNELKQLNQRMFDLLNERDIAQSEKVKSAVRNARLEVDRLYIHLVNAINAFAYVNPAPYESVIRGINETIERLKLQVFKITGARNKPVDGGSSMPGNGETEDGADDENNTDTPNTPGGTTPPAGGDNTGGGSGDNTGGTGGSGSGSNGGSDSGSNGGSTGGGNTGGNTPPDSGNTGEDQPF